MEFIGIPGSDSIPGFEIGKHPVTVQEYAEYLRASGNAAPADWERQMKNPNHPVVSVSFYDAEKFCRHYGYELPTSEQWELAASGKEKRAYPWGNDAPTSFRANYNNNVGGTTPVGAYPLGATPEGVMDMAGNVWEWTK